MAENYEIVVDVFGRTDVGTVRDHNEDNFLVANLGTAERSLKPDIRKHSINSFGSLFAVCDGMGGAAAGEVASALAVDSLFEKMTERSGSFPDRQEHAMKLVEAITYANEVILSTARQNKAQTGMGTTCTAASLIDDVLLVAQVGDSRAYIIRNKKMYQVTKDQTLLNKLMEIGQLKAEDAENYEHSHVILQALGVRDRVDPVLSAVEILPGDALLVCSDGLNDALSDEQILELINYETTGEPINVCKLLTDSACRAGARDNVTVVFARFGGWGYGFGEPTSEVPYLKILRDEYDSHMLLTRNPPGGPDTTQVLGLSISTKTTLKNDSAPRRAHPAWCPSRTPQKELGLPRFISRLCADIVLWESTQAVPVSFLQGRKEAYLHL